jgi:hypothetical protein
VALAAPVSADASHGAVATLPPFTGSATIAADRMRRVTGRPAATPPAPHWFDAFQRLGTAPQWAIAASCLVVAGIGMHIFHGPLQPGYQSWLTQPSPSSAPANNQAMNAMPGSRTIEFAPNEVSAAVQGDLPENQTQIYQFRANKGQVTSINLEGAGVKMNLLRADQSPIDNSSRQARHWTGQLPASESYQIQITGAGAYSLDMAIYPNKPLTHRTAQPLNFDRHRTQTLTGEVLAGKTQRYKLTAQAGQTISYKVLQGDLQIQTIAPTGKPLGHSKTNWKGQAPITGEYTIAITAKQREDYAIAFELK